MKCRSSIHGEDMKYIQDFGLNPMREETTSDTQDIWKEIIKTDLRERNYEYVN
jgi:hypothetical protein